MADFDFDDDDIEAAIAEEEEMHRQYVEEDEFYGIEEEGKHGEAGLQQGGEYQPECVMEEMKLSEEEEGKEEKEQSVRKVDYFRR
mmetsp:Transcript_13361/g.28753  ORF Transcript_13361/g.28753 Transcript_13361/m.28753 type:complete len:85 (+) Transcript_13361:80-334(+)